MTINRVGVVGLGLIGGSIAKTLKEKLNIDVVGLDINKEYVQQALSSGSIINGGSYYSLLKDCDIVFLCMPVQRCIMALNDIASVVKDDCIITDVGSTKEEIVGYAQKNLPNISFIGGHPMVGSEKSGFSESKGHFFENAYYLITPTDDTKNEHLEALINLVEGMGAIPMVISAQEHDFITAAISHVPHIIASNLVNMVKCLDDRDAHMHKLAAGGFKDITRIASSDPTMWQNICTSNSKNICQVIDKFIESLNKFKINLIDSAYDSTHIFFDNAKKYRNSFSTINRGPIEPLFNLYVDIQDKPGVIGEVATLLGRNGINIKNIGISNSREYQVGCLVISFNTQEYLVDAKALLEKEGYTVGI